MCMYVSVCMYLDSMYRFATVSTYTYIHMCKRNVYARVYDEIIVMIIDHTRACVFDWKQDLRCDIVNAQQLSNE